MAVQNAPAQNNMLTAWSPNDARPEKREVLKALVLKIDRKNGPLVSSLVAFSRLDPLSCVMRFLRFPY